MIILASLPLLLKNVRIDDSFWSKYIELIRGTAIPYQWEVLNDRVPDAPLSYGMRNFRIAAGLEQGKFGGFVFQDSDVAKWLEAVGYSLQNQPDPELENIADQAIEIIAKAQQADGYLNTYYTLKEPGNRWTNFRACHELYCAGHMIEAAVAYYEATGKRRLLEVVCRFADHIDSIIGPEPGKMRAYPGHPEIELALVKLYRTTGDDKYLKLSKYFIDERGRDPYYFDLEAEKRGKTVHNPESEKFDRKYSQTHLPVREQATAEGHAVRAVYLYAAMADLAVETNDAGLLDACKRLWENIVNKRMYITGGIGSTACGEAFTFDYDLPNDTMYCETCASVGLVLFARRMLQLDLNGCYADVMEKALYNTVLSGMSLDGRHFFYVNPLEVRSVASAKDPGKAHVQATRQQWFGCACCPPNVARLLSSLGYYIYGQGPREICVHLYIGGEAEFAVDGQKVRLTQKTGYPWEGRATLELAPDVPVEFTLALRVPGWCRQAGVKVNGEKIQLKPALSRGYLLLRRVWHPGDKVEMDFPMPVMLMRAHPNVRADAGKVALQRGPLVYCLEEMDNGPDLHAISVNPTEAGFQASFDRTLLGGTVVIEGQAERADASPWGEGLYQATEEKTDKVTIKAVPYCLWNNRRPGEMLVWIGMRRWSRHLAPRHTAY